MMIERSFVRIREGLVHVRRLDADDSAQPTLCLLHPSPASSRMLEPLMLALRSAGVSGPIIAPDTLGNGDSASPAMDVPDIAYFADSVVRILDASHQETIDIYGAHTGARIACEFAVRHKSRVRRVILDGITEYTDSLKQAILDHYAPDIRPDDFGRQFIWAFNFVRDQCLHFPYFMRDPEHRLHRPMPSAEQLHHGTMDVLKALGSYQKPYLAAFSYEARARLPLIQSPTLFLKPQGELVNLNDAIASFVASMQNAAVVQIGYNDQDRAAAISNFVNQTP